MELDKEEVKNRLIQSNLINTTKGDQKLWKLAFDLYNGSTGSKLKPNCSMCFAKVREWLMK